MIPPKMPKHIPRQRVLSFPDMIFDITKIQLAANARKLKAAWTIELDPNDPDYAKYMAASEEMAKIINEEIAKAILGDLA